MERACATIKARVAAQWSKVLGDPNVPDQLKKDLLDPQRRRKGVRNTPLVELGIPLLIQEQVDWRGLAIFDSFRVDTSFTGLLRRDIVGSWREDDAVYSSYYQPMELKLILWSKSLPPKIICNVRLEALMKNKNSKDNALKSLYDRGKLVSRIKLPLQRIY